jgi:hypothetical protein
MNINFLKSAFSEIPKEKLQIAVSNINAYRNFIGNGVAVGKLAEVIVAEMFSNQKSKINGFSFAFTGKNPPFDIMVYERKVPLEKTDFTDLRRLYKTDYSIFESSISKIVGSKNWCGVSLKNYLNHESQITTNYKVRTLCEKHLGQKQMVFKDNDTVNFLLKSIKEELSHETILLMNSFPDTSSFQFRLFNLDSVQITQIEYVEKTKHSRYVFLNKSGPVFHVKYGKNQANPFQRGIWVDELEQLPLLGSGNYTRSNFAEYILKGALLKH